MSRSAVLRDDAQAPYFEDLEVGYVSDPAPGLTITDAHAAVHQGIVGDRLRLPLDRPLCRAVTGNTAPLAHPALVWDVAIGQSTVVTRRVVANLFYRGLVFSRAPSIGDTLYTTTQVLALRQNSRRPERQASGLALLRVTTTDQNERPVLDFHRCAMLPLRDQAAQTGHADEVDVAHLGEPQAWDVAVRGWRLDRMRAAVPGPSFDALDEGTIWPRSADEVVSSAPELARLSLNLALAHRAGRPGEPGSRLVYGGHTIGIAAAQAAQALPNLVTVVGWHSCEHLAPVREGDLLSSALELERREALEGGGGLLHLRSRVSGRGEAGVADVLDWRFVAVVA